MNHAKPYQYLLKKQLNYRCGIFLVHFFFAFMVNAGAQQKPNIILILGDDVGYRSLTCNGGNVYSTPNIDTLAQKGMRFTQCHASADCSPSRQLLLTGKYNFRNYIDWGVMDRSQKTIANMFKDAGYRTACYGKWQLDGGDTSIKTFGFDNYTIHTPYVYSSELTKYKNPQIYTKGAFLPDSLTLNKYGPDICIDSMFEFINKNKSGPFFIYCPLLLVHNPFSPTPDDTAFANWDPGNADTSFFPSMMHYMDKEIGQIIKKVKEDGLQNNTVILFTGDNGTPPGVIDYIDENGNPVPGGKHELAEAGTHVPLIAYWPGAVAPGTINNDLIDFTDFLPTLAGIAGIPVPTDYGPLDGVSFSDRLTGQPGTPREWIFNYIDRHPGQDVAKRWAQTKIYKLYDTSAVKPQFLFYNIGNDPDEEKPIPDTSLTPGEIIIRQQLLDVINGYVAQGTPLISLNPSLSGITESSVVLKDTIRADGGSTVTASGAVWSTSPYPELSSSSHTTSGVTWGPFGTLVQGLAKNTTYYIRAYATNFAGIVYSNQLIFKTLDAPVATAATSIGTNTFQANWNAYSGSNYRLDVSESPSFTKINKLTVTEGFNNGIIPPAGWTISTNVIVNTTSFATASPSLEFTASNDQVMTKPLGGPATQLSFWIKGLNTNKTSSLLIEGFDGYNWTVITSIAKLPKSGAVKKFNANTNPPLSRNFIQFRFTYTKKAGTLVFDDVSIKYNNPVPYFVPGYKNLKVTTNSKTVTGLKPATGYYYRVRAIKGGALTGNSNIIQVTTSTLNYQLSSVEDSSKTYNALAKASRENMQVKTFPNPLQSILNIDFNAPDITLKRISVYNVNGKLLISKISDDNLQLDVKQLSCRDLTGATLLSGQHRDVKTSDTKR
ncbi:MAG TPA: sulfatase-like hydrolase/transferase [Parafilimonas sp.]|nr:sulfatase-like hydrolase/transferase [Parafilimonas sp.]